MEEVANSWRDWQALGVRLKRVGRIVIPDSMGRGIGPETGTVTKIYLEFEKPERHPFHSGLWTFVVLRRKGEPKIVAIVPPECECSSDEKSKP